MCEEGSHDEVAIDEEDEGGEGDKNIHANLYGRSISIIIRILNQQGSE